jgi:hypothetical protein
MKGWTLVFVSSLPPGQLKQPVQVPMTTKLLFWIEEPSCRVMLAPLYTKGSESPLREINYYQLQVQLVARFRETHVPRRVLTVISSIDN